MKTKLLKQKALFEIFLIISLSFYSSLSFASLNKIKENTNENKISYFDLIKQELIPSVSAETKACCEKTTSGNSCEFTEKSNCVINKPNNGGTYGNEEIACEQTDYCGLNCCIKEGVCKDKVERGICESTNGESRTGECSALPLCSVGCCNLPSGASITTQAQCANTVKKFPGLVLSNVFDASVTDAAACAARSRGTEEGCCVLTDKCVFGTRKQCNDLNGNGDAFRLGKICSSIPSCLVTPKTTTACYNNKVYWQDSAGNRENIVGFADSDQIIKPKETGSCKLQYDSNGNIISNSDLNCGNCDYSEGSACQNADDDFLTRLSSSSVANKERIKNQCVSLNCKETIESKKNSNNEEINPWMNGDPKKNGESWCEYEGKVGEGKDLVGSRHYLHKCLNGREIIEPCKTERKEICVQGEQPKEATGLDYDLSTARCVENKGNICLTANSEESQNCEPEGNSEDYISGVGDYADKKGCGGECYALKDIKQDEYRSCCKKQLCRREECDGLGAKATCYFNENVKLCAPSVPLGTLKAVSKDTSAERDDLETPFEYSCKEIWAIEGAEFFFNWNCAANCIGENEGICHLSQTANEWNSFCRSLGDYGAHYNVKERYTKNGFIASKPTGYPGGEAFYWDDSFYSQKGQKNYTGVKGVTTSSNDKDNFNKNSEEGWLKGNVDFLFAVVGSISGRSNAELTSVYHQDSSSYIIGSGIIGGLGLTGLALYAIFPSLSATGVFSISNAIGAAHIAEFFGGVVTTTITATTQTGTAIAAGTTIATNAGTVITGTVATGTAGTAGTAATAGTLAVEGGTVPVSVTTTTTVGGASTVAWILGPIFIALALILVFAPEWIFGKAKQKEVTYKFSCRSWTPPKKGNDCEKCNDFTECDEYKCLSLGKACESIGTPGNITCVWKNPGDTSPPIRSLLEIAPRTRTNYAVIPKSEINDGGYIVKNLNNPPSDILPAYAELTIGVRTDERSTCKISRFDNKKYDDIPDSNIFGSPYPNFDHKMTIPIAREGLLPEEDIVASECGKENLFYVKCSDVNEVKNEKPYFIKFTTGTCADTTEPIIKDYSIRNNAYLPYNLNHTRLVVYLDEPVEQCRVSTVANQIYDLMPKNLTCSSNKERNGYYPCAIAYLDVKANQDNIFYFKCKDLANPPNINRNDQPAEGYKLKSSKALKISSSGPNGRVLSTEVKLTAATSEGAESGKAVCYYNVLKAFGPGSVKFTTTESENHETTLPLQNEQDYTFYLGCRDIAGNEDNSTIKFHTTTPDLNITNALPNNEIIYSDKVQLQVKTKGGIKLNGESDCSYKSISGRTLASGNLNDGKIIQGEETTHYKNLTSLENGNYELEIICNDQYKKDNATIRFTVDVLGIPKIIRIFRQNSLLNVITNRKAECHYSPTQNNFKFEEGTLMISTDNLIHSLQIANSNVYYIKCKDINTNNIAPDKINSYVVYP